MKWELHLGGAEHGSIAQYEYDLATEKPQKFLVSPSMLDYKDIAVEIVCIECTGTAVANATIHETNIKTGGSAYNYTTGVTVAVGVNSNAFAKVANFMGEFVSIELPALGSVGKLRVRITGKN